MKKRKEIVPWSAVVQSGSSPWALSCPRLHVSKPPIHSTGPHPGSGGGVEWGGFGLRAAQGQQLKISPSGAPSSV